MCSLPIDPLFDNLLFKIPLHQYTSEFSKTLGKSLDGIFQQPTETYLHFLLFCSELIERYIVILQIGHSAVISMFFNSILVHLKCVFQFIPVALLQLFDLTTSQLQKIILENNQLHLKSLPTAYTFMEDRWPAFAKLHILAEFFTFHQLLQHGVSHFFANFDFLQQVFSSLSQ